jgi:tetratricopeptide (TPR) repeat protein
MRRFLLSLSFVTLLLAAPQCAFSQSADTSDLFLNAYMANEQGEHMESSGDPQKALSKYRYAASLLDQIAREDPKWQPIVVDYRKKKVSENITRLQQQIAAEAPTPSAPIEGELPQRDNSSGLTQGVPQTSGATSAATGGGMSQQVRDQLDQLQNDLRESRQKLKTVENQKEDLAGKLDDALKQLDRTKISDVELKGQLKQAQDAYQNSLTDHSQSAGSQKDLQTKVSQLQTALKNAEADRDAANEQNAAETRRAKTQETAEAELKTQLKQAQDALAARSQPNAAQSAAQKALETRVAQLETALKNTEADRDAADEENADYARRNAKAHEATAEVAKERDAANSHAKDMEAKYADASKLASQLDAANKKIAALTRSRDDATEHANDLDKQLAATAETAAKLADAQKQITTLKADNAEVLQKDTDISGKLADARKQIDQLTGDRDSARQQITKLDGKLADAQKEIVAVKSDRDQIAAQRDQALADLGKAREAAKHVDQLIAQNASLMQKVAADEKVIQDFKSDSPQKDKEIADLRKEVSDTKALLTATQQDRDNVQSTLNDLQQQYDSTSAELVDLKANTAVSSSEKKTLTDENDLLRGIVLRELKQQAHRDQAKRLVMSELSQLQIQSDTLLQQIDLLGQPVVQLTDKEKGLFKDPSIDLPDADDSTMAISIAAPKRTATIHQAIPVPATAEDSLPAKTGTAAPLPSAAPDTAANSPAPAAPAAPAASPSAAPMELAKRTSASSPEAALNSAPSAPSTEKPAPATETPAPAASPADASHPDTAATGNPMVPTDLMDDAKAAKEAFERNQYRDAEKVYERMLTKAPNNVYVLSNLGVVYFRNQKFKLAEESLQKAIAVAPEDTFSHCTLGIVYYQEKRYDDAINSLTRALAINPKYAVAHNYLGITASQKGWQEAALKELETAIDLDPNYGDACFNLAVVYAMQQPPNKDMARKYYKRATDLGAEPDAGLEQLVK